MSNLVVQLLLKTEEFQEDVLNKRFETYRKNRHLCMEY